MSGLAFVGVVAFVALGVLALFVFVWSIAGLRIEYERTRRRR